MISLSEQIAFLDLTALARAFTMAIGFVVALFIASRVLPGKQVLGASLANGERLSYKIDGLWLFLLLVAYIALGTIFGGYSLAIVQHHFLALWIVANVLSIALTVALYFTGKSERRGLLKDLWFGADLNPRWLGVDLKMFSYKPSLLGLMLINASFAYAQYEAYGRLGQAMLLYEALTFVYVLNYFQFEQGMLHTWDIMSERFGFMLVWGDYAFVPFCYSVTGWYLVDRLEPLPWPLLIGLPCLFLFGLWVFRGANSQKDRFKRDPNVRIWGKPAETLGGRILVSGFWGIGRKLNYSGEICVYIAWTALSGTSSIVPWLVPLWLITLLSHRAWRDDRRCRDKYGQLWEQYCRRARFRMLPFVY